MPTVPSISFNVRYDLTGAPTLVLTDATTLPVGAVGIFTITQPDGYVRTGNFSTPDVTSSGGTLSTGLRLSSTGGVQCGTHNIKYEIKTTDDVISTFTRNYVFQYEPVGLVMTENFDVFTPNLSYSDSTVYTVPNYSNTAPTRAWTAVSIPTGTKTSTTAAINLQHNGSYYDAVYTITLASTLTYSHQTYAWLSIQETISKTVTAEACTPELIEDLIPMIEVLRQKSIECNGDFPDFEKAQTLFSHLTDMLRVLLLGGVTQEGIYDVYEDLMAILRNHVPCVHTNLPIPPYDLGDYAVSQFPIDAAFCQNVGDGVNTVYSVTHNLNDDCVLVQVYEVTSGAQVLTDVTVTSNNSVNVSFAAAPATGAYKVVVHSGNGGMKGDPGEGVPTGGTTGQYLRKTSATDYATAWDTLDSADIPDLSAFYVTPAAAASAYVALGGSYANPSWITALAWSKITGAPAFLTTETDPIFTAHPAFGITGTKISNWDDAYTWVAAFPSQTGNTGKFLSTDGSALSWADVITSNIYTADGTLTGNRVVTMGSYTLSFEKDLLVNGLTLGKGSGNLSSNTFIGVVTSSSISGLGLNTLVGYNVGGAFTTANTNTIVGSNSGYGITTGNANVIIGSSSAYSISTTSGNVVLGNLAYRTGVGATNVVIGNAANYNGVSGNDNVYIGRNTAQFITSGANNVTLGGMTARVGTSITIANNSTFIGYGANPLADNQTNQIVVGYNAVGLGSNTTVIGNSSTLTSAIYGNLLLGTTTDAGYKLDVNGTARVSGNLTVTSGDISTDQRLFANTGVFTNVYFYGVNAGVNIGASGGQGFIRNYISNGTLGNLEIGGDGINIYTGGSSTTGASLIVGSNSAHASAQLKVDSTTRGFLPPRMTTTQRDAIASPATGLVIYNTTTLAANVYNGTSWVGMGGGGDNIYTADGTLTADRTVSGGGYTLTLSPKTIFNYTGNAGTPEQTTPLLGVSFSQTFTATASNVLVYGVDISPTFNTGGGAYLTAAALRLGNSTGYAIYQSNASVISRFDGRVDIGGGATSPIAKLEVLATSSRGIRVIGNDPTNGGVLIGSSLGNTFGLIAGITNQTQNGFTFRNITTSTDLYTIHNNGNVIIGGTTDAGYKLDVQGTGRLTGTLHLTNSTGTISFGSAMFPSLIRANGQNLDIQNYNNGGTGSTGGLNIGSAGAIIYLGAGQQYTGAYFRSDFADSGVTNNGSHNEIQIAGSVNMTFAGSGIQRSLYINKTITAASSYRAIEWNNNTHWGLYGVGTADNYLAGKLLIGTTTASTYLLDVNGTARVSGHSDGLSFSATGSANTRTTSIGTFVDFQTTHGRLFAYNFNTNAWLPILLGSSRLILSTSLGSRTESFVASTAYFSGDVRMISQQTFFGATESNGIFSPSTYSNANYPVIESNSIGLIAGTNGIVNPAWIAATKISFQIGQGTDTKIAQFSPTSGNFIIQNGGTFTDNASALIQMNSTTKGFLPPRMTTTQRTAISSPAVGLIVYQTDSTEGTYEYTSTGWRIINAAGGGSGTVTTVSVASANGFAGTVSNATTTPAITISTTVTGLLKGNGTAISAATAGTDYLTPSDVAYSIASVTTTHSETATKGTKIIKADTTGGAFTINLPTAVGNTATIIIKKVAGSGALTIDGNSTETIDGGTTATINKVYESITLISDNTNWQIV